MLGSLLVYGGFVTAGVALVSLLKPLPWIGLGTTRSSVIALAVAAVAIAAGLFLPARDSRVSSPTSRLDEFVPVWQFNELHTIEISTSPDSVFEAIRNVRADEVALFRALTWIRRGGRDAPESILNPGQEKSLIDVALGSGFVLLAEDRPREIVIGTVVVVPPGTKGELTGAVFKAQLPPGFALAAMNFRVDSIGAGRTRVITETRVFANSPSARRKFGVYWRLIYPGSAIIRRMWLRAVRARAEHGTI